MSMSVKEPAYYAVAHIASGKIRKTTSELGVAARALVPGTCWGSGDDALDAQHDAMLQAAWFRMQK